MSQDTPQRGRRSLPAIRAENPAPATAPRLSLLHWSRAKLKSCFGRPFDSPWPATLSCSNFSWVGYCRGSA
jgi:hypothetical protein